MENEISIQREDMYNKSTENVRKHLNAMLREIEEEMSNRADEVFITMRRDYRSVLGGEEVPQGEVMPKWAKDMRRDVMKVIDGVEDHFTKIEDEGDLSGQEEGDPMDLNKEVAAHTQAGETAAASDSDNRQSSKLSGETNMSSDSKAPDADTDADPETARTAALGTDPAEHCDHIKNEEKQEIAGPVSEDTEMGDAPPAALPEPAVEDSQSNSSRAITPAKDGTVVKGDSVAQSHDDGAVADGEMDTSAKEILDW